MPKRYQEFRYPGVPSTAANQRSNEIIVNRDKTEVRDYLLGRLAEADEEQIELRLLSDPAFGEEVDTVADEITDDYLNDQLSDDERERVEKYFLSSPERQHKLEFAAELLRRAESERGKKVTRYSLLDYIVAFLRQPTPVAAMAAVVFVIGLTLFEMWSAPPPANYLSLNLTISDSDRASSITAATVKPPSNTGLRITLTIPENARGAGDYVAQFPDGTYLEIENRTDTTLTVKVPPAFIKPGTSGIQLFKVKPDDTKERITGTYYFAVE